MIVILSECGRLQFKEKYVSELYLSGMVDRSISTRSNASLIETYRNIGQYSIQGYSQKVVLYQLDNPELSEYYEITYRQFNVGVACGCGELLTFNTARYISDTYNTLELFQSNSMEIYKIINNPPGFKIVR